MAKANKVEADETAVSGSQLNVTAPLLLASMMLTIIAMVASAATGFS